MREDRCCQNLAYYSLSVLHPHKEGGCTEEMRQHTINGLEVPEGFVGSGRGGVSARGCHLAYLPEIVFKMLRRISVNFVECTCNTVVKLETTAHQFLTAFDLWRERERESFILRQHGPGVGISTPNVACRSVYIELRRTKSTVGVILFGLVTSIRLT